jgi:DNA end-binding protein Ku
VTLRFHDEVRTPEEVGLPDPVKPAATLVERFARAIEAGTRDGLDPKELADRDGRRLRELAKAKLARRKDVVRAPQAEETEPAAAVDLLEELRKSLGSKVRPQKRAAARRSA